MCKALDVQSPPSIPGELGVGQREVVVADRVAIGVVTAKRGEVVERGKAGEQDIGKEGI